MDKQLTMSFWTDELSEVKTHIPGADEPTGVVGRMGEESTAALLQRRGREQALRPGTDTSDPRIAEPVQPGRHGSDEQDHRQSRIFLILPGRFKQSDTGW